MRILGIHDSHNASAALLEDGRLVAAVQEERLTREKNQYGIPRLAIQDILEMTGLGMQDIDYFAFASRYLTFTLAGNRDTLLHAFAQALHAAEASNLQAQRPADIAGNEP